jgi:hypothetical protein
MQGRAAIIVLVLSAVVIACAAAFASTHPDGLEWVANGLGFAGRTEAMDIAPLAGYQLPVAEDSFLSTFIAGLIGAITVFIVVYLFGRSIVGLLKHRSLRTHA